jgi:(p)ppGpp synthase/HD superfamily hydrolase
MRELSTPAALLKAARFAADRHRRQRRRDAEASPYINHPVEVAELLARVGGVGDPVALQAALLHDTLEDTETTPEELEAEFGPEVRRVVEEVTDDMRLPEPERRRLQVEHAPRLSRRAKQVKIADKISNVRMVAESPPADWPPERRRAYLDWAERVVAGCRGCNAALEACFDQALSAGRQSLSR